MEEIQPPFVRDMQRGAPEVFALIEQRRAGIIREHFGALLRKSPGWNDPQRHVHDTAHRGHARGGECSHESRQTGGTETSAREGLLSILRIVLEGAMTEKGRAKLQNDHGSSRDDRPLRQSGGLKWDTRG